MARIGDAGRLKCSTCGSLVGPPIELELRTVSTAERSLYVPVEVVVPDRCGQALVRAVRLHVEESTACEGGRVSIEPPLDGDREPAS